MSDSSNLFTLTDSKVPAQKNEIKTTNSATTGLFPQSPTPIFSTITQLPVTKNLNNDFTNKTFFDYSKINKIQTNTENIDVFDKTNNNNEEEFKKKYIKYKNKYLQLLNQSKK